MYSVKLVKTARKRALTRKIIDIGNELGSNRIQSISVENKGFSIGRNNLAYIAYSTNDAINKNIKKGELKYKKYRSFFYKRSHQKAVDFANSLSANQFVTYIFRSDASFFMGKRAEIFYVE